MLPASAAESQVWQQANLKTLDMSKIQQQIDAATAKINSPELQRQIENLQKQIASGDMQRCMEQAVQAMKETESRINKAPTK